ncbi:MAG: MFS transporter [Thermoproteus sp. AZ2]|jgi:hypothetical protein|uniref:MFS transporter n=1 Tax=Thermoproteus sp. AZ2 TaxID=1609232 RepID=A0ACC6V0X9_9CREN|nr:MAG: transporter [Thermoproteus sp. AZ2]
MSALDSAAWGRAHWRLFAVISASFLLDGVLFSLVPTVIYLVQNLAQYATAIMAADSAAFLLGALALGRISDAVGRRLGLIISLAIYTAAALAFVAAYWAGSLGLAAATATTALMNFGVGGEMGPAYAALAELSPARHRGKALMMAANFWNIGAAAIAALSLAYAALSSNPRTVVLATFATALALALLVLLARLHLPESPRWLAARGRVVEARRVVASFAGVEEDPPPQPPGVGLSEALRTKPLGLSVLVAVAAAQLATYNIAAYYAPYAPGFPFGESSAPLLIAIANAGASIGAFLLLPVIDRSRRISLAASFAGGLATAAALLATLGLLSAYSAILFVNMIFAEWAWAALSVLESELFPTGVRSSVVGLITASAWALNTALVAVEGLISATPFLIANAAIWAVGLAAAALWHLRGVETAQRTLEELAAK